MVPGLPSSMAATTLVVVPAVERGRRASGAGSSEGWLQGPAGSYVYQGCTHLGAPRGGFSGSGQCPPVTLNHPAVQSGPSRVRMRTGSAASTSRCAPPSQLHPALPQPPCIHHAGVRPVSVL
ncbi:hypothetical protein KM043_013637 [Ampulex compressa]|nr:hypothetical protein KM043_013637 [Ampulex compressa]